MSRYTCRNNTRKYVENRKEKQKKTQTMNRRKNQQGIKQRTGIFQEEHCFGKSLKIVEKTFLLLVSFLQYSGSSRKETKTRSQFLLIKENKITASFCKLESKGVIVCSVNNSRYEINNEDPRQPFHTQWILLIISKCELPFYLTDQG